MKKFLITFYIILISTLLPAKSGLTTESYIYQNQNNRYKNYGFMLAYAPVNEGYSAKIYGIPENNMLSTNFSYFSLYHARKGSFKGGEFDDSPLDFWVKEDEDIYRKYIVNLGVTQGLTAQGGIFLAYYAGLGLSEEFHQYKSSYGNYWFKNENKMIGDIGIELNGRLSVINFGIGFSYQSLYYLSAGLEF